MKKILFVNQWGYPDIHITREFCKEFILRFKQEQEKEEEEISAQYFCFKDADLLVDVCPVTVRHESYSHLDLDVEDRNTLTLNTHYSSLNKIDPANKESNRLKQTYELFKYYYKKFLDWDLSNEAYELHNFIPTIDYDSFCCILPRYLNEIKLNDKNYILFDNSFSEYDFDDNLSYDKIITNLAKKNKDKKIIITQPNEKLDEIENVFNVSKIFPFFCNINEASWLSLRCQTVIGKTKDYFAASLVKENVFNPDKRFINITENEQDIIIPPELYEGEYINLNYKDADNINEIL